MRSQRVWHDLVTKQQQQLTFCKMKWKRPCFPGTQNESRSVSCSVMSDYLQPHGPEPSRLLSMGFSRQESWSGLPFPSPGDLPNPGIEPGFPQLQADPLPSKTPKTQNNLSISVLNYCGVGFPGGTSGKEPACQYRRPKRYRFDPWVGKNPWRKAWQLTPVFLPGESRGQRRPTLGLQSVWLQRVRHNWSTLHVHAYTVTQWITVREREDSGDIYAWSQCIWAPYTLCLTPVNAKWEIHALNGCLLSVSYTPDSGPVSGGDSSHKTQSLCSGRERECWRHTEAQEQLRAGPSIGPVGSWCAKA